MSVQCMSDVFKYSRSKLGARLVLLSIANHANAEGVDSWPSILSIGEEAGLSEREVRYSIRKLEEMGELVTIRGVGRGNSNVYRVTVAPEKRVIVAPEKKGANIAPIVGDENEGVSTTKGANSAPITKEEKGQSATVKGAKSVTQKGQSATIKGAKSVGAYKELTILNHPDNQPEPSRARARPPDGLAGGRIFNPELPKTAEETLEFFSSHTSSESEARKFFAYYAKRRWEVGGTPVHSWQGLAEKWIADAPRFTKHKRDHAPPERSAQNHEPRTGVPQSLGALLSVNGNPDEVAAGASAASFEAFLKSKGLRHGVQWTMNRGKFCGAGIGQKWKEFQEKSKR